ncbi:hypothetical protein CEXT_407851 [Caerostris extrusa]|uniref:Uncharacterized protein n=1 Tax=Caerostris extrusa TaxID=172846 RepID=A0AAV4QLK3_CAEEX|nr:hypothetical protein CEXT_407851 [Caerostris extrusa]
MRDKRLGFSFEMDFHFPIGKTPFIPRVNDGIHRGLLVMVKHHVEYCPFSDERLRIKSPVIPENSTDGVD